MNGFVPYEVLVRTRDGHHITLAEPLIYTARSGEVITIPPGADSDGASTPHIIWSVFPPFGRYWKPAILHDYLYRRDPQRRPKQECDALLLEAMLANGVDNPTAEVIYKGVVEGGQSSFDEDRKNQGGITQ